MAANSELTVMRSAGLSVWRVMVAVLKPVAVLMVLSTLTAEYAIPQLEKIAQSQKAVAQGKGESLSNDGRGYWHREGDQFMRFTAIEPNGVLHGINLFSFDEERNLTRVLTAERAIYQRNQWQMQNVRDVNVTPQILIENDHDTLEWDTGYAQQYQGKGAQRLQHLAPERQQIVIRIQALIT